MPSESFYAPVPELPREDHLAAYLAFLEKRNGTTDAAKTYPKRDAWLEQSRAWKARYKGELDSEAFDRHYETFDTRLKPDHAMAAVLAFVKVNAGEAYGVEVVSKRRHGKPPTGELFDRVERAIGQEETYHTKILLGATQQFGMHAPKSAWNPSFAIKAVVGAIAYAPRGIFHPILLGTEIGGVFAFNWLLGRVGELFKDQPDLVETLEERLTEILIDEVGHIAFNRIAVGPTGMNIARNMAPHVAHATSGGLPEFQAIGWTKDAVDRFDAFDLHSLPEQVREHSFFV